MTAMGFLLLADTLTPMLASVHLLEDAMDTMDDISHEVLDYAQANAPWEDRTGDARDGLQTEVKLEGDSVVLELYHTVDYGIWLETIQNGTFAIIMPTLEHYEGEVMRRMNATPSGGDA